ncbi:AEC family transporter [Pseudacidovorax sp. RU35E]|uniref:AEC family transporter n=1 Tax=Pseudacidovorax sp. RU35E TaxID=1907403 RepID=UPI00095657D5|nr:AEC family transporter [Pseudacidovorax sp. RU35E]SIR56759.1 hypothetical protein SAMN05880557_113118 [Pseudacidovorax sp. RU35E]
MLAILSITVPIYLAIAAGWLVTRGGLFARGDMRVLGLFVIRLALPALLFSALVQRPAGDVLNLRYMLLYALGSMLTLFVGRWWAARQAPAGSPVPALMAMGMSCPNSGFVGYPILSMVIAQTAGLVLGQNMIVENLLLVPLAMALADAADGRGDWRLTLRRAAHSLARNPMIWAMAAGVAVALTGLRLPAPLLRTIGLFAQASTALSLFVIGGSLVGLGLAGMRRQVLRIAAGKLLLHPALMLAVLLAAEALGMPPMEPALRLALVLSAAAPMLSIYPILAQPHGQDSLAAASLLATTALSFFTISALLAVLPHLLGV